MRRTLILALLSSALPATGWAQTMPEQPAAADPAPRGDDGEDFHTTTSDIIVTAPFTRSLDLFGNVGVLDGDALARDLRPQIGDALTGEPGVSATSFSPGASRPVVRGFQGERVRVLVDGIGSIDVSNTSADHGVTIDPLTAERIEVLRGPASLLFGSSAIGGAINIFDRRIPRAVPDEPVHIDAIATYGSAADERNVGGSLDFTLSPQLVLHVDGAYTRADDLRVGGYQFAPDLRADLLATAAEEQDEGHVEEADELTAAANHRGRVPNTAVETWSAGAGLALVNDGGSLGVSIGYLDSRYGVPLRPGSGHLHDEEAASPASEGGHEGEDAPVTIALTQWRADLRGEVLTGGFFDRLRIRAGFADYEHVELEGAEVGTRFLNQGIEGRIELVQAERGGWSGASGIQYVYRDFDANGAEAFVPHNLTEQFALFTLQEVRFGPVDLELSGRWEHSRIAAPGLGISWRFDAVSGAVGLSYEFDNRSKLGINLARSARAPSAEELFSDGAHIATQAYELGNPDAGIERAWSVEAFGRLRQGPLDIAVTAYHSWFSNFIFADATGIVRDDLPLFAYRQADVRHYGFELDASARLGHVGPFAVTTDVVADYVRTSVTGGGVLPRIPPLRLLGGVGLEQQRLSLRGEVEHVFAQNRIAAFETPTDGFTLVNLSAQWRPLGETGGVTFLLAANNLFDVDARRHASFTKDFVPLAGRDLRVTARFSF